MIKINKISLKNAFKSYHEKNDINVNDNIIFKNHVNYYYNWIEKIHFLMKKKKWKIDLYLVKSSYEDEMKKRILLFKMRFSAIIQRHSSNSYNFTIEFVLRSTQKRKTKNLIQLHLEINDKKFSN